MAARNIRDVNKRMEEGEIFPTDLGRFVIDTLDARETYGHNRTKPPPEADKSFHDAYNLFRDTGHIESLPTTKQKQDAIFDKEMKRFYKNPIQFYNAHKDDPEWFFQKNTEYITKKFEHHHMTRWFDEASGVGEAHFTNKEWKAFGF
mgnify:CR=1 FL=1